MVHVRPAIRPITPLISAIASGATITVLIFIAVTVDADDANDEDEYR